MTVIKASTWATSVDTASKFSTIWVRRRWILLPAWISRREKQLAFMLAARLRQLTAPSRCLRPWPAPPPRHLRSSFSPSGGACAHRAGAFGGHSIGLQQSLAGLRRFNFQNAIYGDNLTKAAADLNSALAAVSDAVVYVQAHPEVDDLKNGPVAGDAIKIPLLPGVQGDAGRTGLVDCVVALHAALELLVNNPSGDYHGPVLGDFGGLRVKIITAIGQAGADLNAGVVLSLSNSNDMILVFFQRPALPRCARSGFGPACRRFLRASP